MKVKEKNIHSFSWQLIKTDKSEPNYEVTVLLS
jgi:hypothetical protein